MNWIVSAAMTIWGFIKTYGSIVMTLASVAYSAYQMATAPGAPKKDDNRLQTVRSSVSPHRVIYGETVVGGVLFYAQYHDIDPYTGEKDDNDETNTYISLGIVFACHQIEEFVEIWLNDKLSTDNIFKRHFDAKPEQGHFQWNNETKQLEWVVDVEATPAFDGSYVTINYHLGTENQEADEFLLSLPPKPSALITKYPQSGLSDLKVHNNSNGTSPFTGVGMAVFTIRVTDVNDDRDIVHWRMDTYEGDGETHNTVSEGDLTIGTFLQHMDKNIEIRWEHLTGHSVGQTWEIRAFDGSPWTANCRAQGRAYIIVTIKHSDKKFPNGLPNIKAKIKGANQIYDPRTETTGYTNNWELCVRDYLAKPFGLESPDEDINVDVTIEGANACDELITLADGTTQARYTMDGSFTLDKTPIDIMNDMLLAANGVLTWTQGQYWILPAVYRIPDLTFHGMNPDIPGLTESDLRGNIKVRPLPSMRDKFNTVKGTFISPETWESIDFHKVKSDYYIEQDGDVVLTRDVQFIYITDSARAQRVAKIILEKARQAICVDFPAKWSAFPLAVGDNVPITISYLGWDQKVFTITNWELDPDGGVNLQLREEAEGCYDWNNGEETTVDLAPNTNLPEPTYVPPITGLTVGEELYTGNVTSVIKSRAIITWDQVGCAQYEVSYLGPTNTIWTVLPLVVSNNVITLDDTTPGVYTFRIRGMNWLNVWSDDYVSITTTLVGKMAPPSDVVGFKALISKSFVDLSWTPNTDLDIDHYEIRVGSTWDDGEIIVSNLKSSKYLWAPNQSGDLQFWICAVDTSGNYSENPITAIITIIPASIVSPTQQVIDNNVLLKWANIAGSFAIDFVEVWKGTTFEEAIKIGSIYGTFTTIFETDSGTYIYWLVPVDVSGLNGTPVSISAIVSQPPDYVLHDQRTLAFTGTFTSCIKDNDRLIAPVNITETFQEHFTTHSWDQPQDQIDAGYTYFLQPSPPTAQYQEIIDYGAIISSSKITLSIDTLALVGEVTITPTISISANGFSWTDCEDVWSVMATYFKYIRITLDFSTSDAGIILITRSNIKLDVKLTTAQGVCNALSTDTNGTVVDITGKFIDVQSITLTPQGTTAALAVYDFTDVPNPTQFRIYLYNASGNRITGVVSWVVRGLASSGSGTGSGSSASVPGAPTSITATAGNQSAVVAFNAPADNGGSSITGYTVTSSPGNITATGLASPITISGLTNGTVYTFTVTATNATGTSDPSSASNSITPLSLPGAPTIGTATLSGSSAIVTFTAPTSNGGSPITGYTVTSDHGDLSNTGTSSPITVSGLVTGQSYTFSVTATTAVGTGPASAASNSVGTSTVPGAPTIGTAQAGAAQATVVFTAPSDNGGSPILSYTAISYPGGLTATGTTSPIVVSGLVNGTSYVFRVRAHNANGDSTLSEASNAVVPLGPISFTFNGTTFNPNLVTEGTVSINWIFDDGTTSSSNTPNHTFSTSGIHTITLDMSPWSAMRRLNFGDTDIDGAPYEEWPVQNLTGTSLFGELAPYLRQWCSMLSDITTLDFTNFTVLTDIRYYGSSNKSLTSINVTGCTALERLIVENNSLTYLDISTLTSLRELRASNNGITNLGVGTTIGVAFKHLCAWGNPYNVDMASFIARCTALQELFWSGTNQGGTFTAPSTDMWLVTLYNNTFTSVDLSGSFAVQSFSISEFGFEPGRVALEYNSITTVDISDCPGIMNMTIYNNPLTQATITHILSSLDSFGRRGGTITMNSTATPTTAARSYASNLRNKGWSVSVDGATPMLITPNSLSLNNATKNSAFSQTLSVSEGTSPYTWSLLSGAFASGLSISSGGVISGTPTESGNFSVVVRCTDNVGATSDRPYNHKVISDIATITFTTSGATVNMQVTTDRAATVTWYWDTGGVNQQYVDTLSGAGYAYGTGGGAHNFGSAGNRTSTVTVNPAAACVYFGHTEGTTNQGITGVSGMPDMPNLATIGFYQESLTALSLAGMTALSQVRLGGNNFTSSVIDQWFIDLDSIGNGWGIIYYPSSPGYTSASATARANLTAKSWTITGV